MRRVIILQARMGSTRLPGKVLMPVLGKPLLAYEIERLQKVQQPHLLVVATTTNPEDNVIETLCKALKVQCFRGSELDVLDRFYDTAIAARAETIVRVTGDCPLIDPLVVSAIIDQFEESQLGKTPTDYCSNSLQRTFPRGLDAEVFSIGALEAAWQKAIEPVDREHVTGYLYQHPEQFNITQYQQAKNQSAHRWTVDTPEDFALIEQILTALYPEKPNFTQQDVLDLLKLHPDWSALNAHIEQVKPYQSSIQAGSAEL